MKNSAAEATIGPRAVPALGPRADRRRHVAAGPRPPAGYTAEAKKLWQDVLEGWQLDPAALVILDSACRALMRVRQAQARLDRDGLVVRDRFKQEKPHPCATIERDAKQTLLRSLRALNL